MVASRGVATIVAAGLVAFASVGLVGKKPVAADEPAATNAAAIRAAAAAYREALAKGDAEAVRKAWTADGDIVDGWGNLLSAQDESAVRGDTRAAARPRFRFGETRLRFVTPDVALEDGSVDTILPGTSVPIEGSFTAVWVRRDGSWKIAGLRESERPVSLDAGILEDLDWLVGEWVLATEGGAAAEDAPDMEMTVRWDAGRTFLVREARLKNREVDDEPAVIDVHQRIGWDPVVGRIRSWSFSTDGSRGEATWFRDGDSWVARGSSVLADGTQMNSLNIYSFDGKDRCIWRTMPEPLASAEGVPTRATWIRKQGSAKP